MNDFGSNVAVPQAKKYMWDRIAPEEKCVCVYEAYKRLTNLSNTHEQLFPRVLSCPEIERGGR